MNIIFLIPPSEGKNILGEKKEKEVTSFSFEKPLNIAQNATEKDLKCKEKRFEEAIHLNKNIQNSLVLDAIERYSGVMFSHINYENMSEKGKKFFSSNFLILSGMYGILKIEDKIGNYKLPISTRGLYNFWGDKIFNNIIDIEPKVIVNLLPKDYEKILNLKKNKNILEQKGISFVNVNFIKLDGKKVSHGVKSIKGKWIFDICEKNITDYKNFGGVLEKDGVFINVNILQK